MNKRRILALVLACVLCVCIGIGGTLAWLTAQTTPVQNTFTTSDINITLEETKGGADREFKMVPGFTIEKDPKVTVATNSEDCWLFVKIDKSATLDTYITYTVDSKWTAGTGTDEGGNGVPKGVYFRKISGDSNKGIALDVIGYRNAEGQFVANTVLVKDTVTKTDMNDLSKANAIQPTLTVTAYASQLYKTNGTQFTAAEAWAVLNP